MARADTARRADRDEITARIDELEARLREAEGEGTGELSDVDQHPGDRATELYEREQDIQRLETLREELRMLDDASARPDAPPVPRGERLQPDPDGDDSTPLDEPEPREDLSAIPMGKQPKLDPESPPIDAPGMVYTDGAEEPAVGDPDPKQERIERRGYRPRR
jgi:hypothetical protein